MVFIFILYINSIVNIFYINVPHVNGAAVGSPASFLYLCQMKNVQQQKPYKAIICQNRHQIIHGCNQRTGSHCRVYQDLIFDTKEKALSGAQTPKKA